MGKTTIQINHPKYWRLPPLQAGDHKYTHGHVLLLGGTTMTGAARLAALAAQRSGAGMVTLAAPASVWPVYASALMSVIVRKLVKPADWASIIKQRKITAILLGPGNEPSELRSPLATSIKSGLPLVLDAGVLTLMGTDKSVRQKLKATRFACLPHEGEYTRLAKAMGLDAKADKATRAAAMAKALGGVVLLKGAETIIASPDGRILRNTSNAPWLATAGTGDVLAGIISGLAAQGMDLFDACCAGAWIHSETAKSFGRGMVAEDLLPAIPAVLRTLK